MKPYLYKEIANITVHVKVCDSALRCSETFGPLSLEVSRMENNQVSWVASLEYGWVSVVQTLFSKGPKRQLYDHGKNNMAEPKQW